jgi:cytochrome P450
MRLGLRLGAFLAPGTGSPPLHRSRALRSTRRAAGCEPAGTGPDYLSMFLQVRDKDTGEGMTDREVMDEITTLIIAGHETTASMLNWTWYLLAGHPDVEARLHAEIDARPDEDIPGLASMEELRYANDILKEALRLYPPVWVISRRTIEPDVLGGYAVPAGTDVFISPYFIHRHPDYWQDADSFRPERFDTEDQDRRRLIYIPFSAGAHHCIGESLSIYEGLAHLFKVARRYRLLKVDDATPEFEALINLRTRRPIHMRLEPRTATLKGHP